MTAAELGNDLHALEQPLGDGFPDALSALADLLANGAWFAVVKVMTWVSENRGAQDSAVGRLSTHIDRSSSWDLEAPSGFERFLS